MCKNSISKCLSRDLFMLCAKNEWPVLRIDLLNSQSFSLFLLWILSFQQFFTRFLFIFWNFCFLFIIYSHSPGKTLNNRQSLLCKTVINSSDGFSHLIYSCDCYPNRNDCVKFCWVGTIERLTTQNGVSFSRISKCFYSARKLIRDSWNQ